MLWNRNKRSVTLDLKSAGGLAPFKAMAAGADIVIESFKLDRRSRSSRIHLRTSSFRIHR